MLDVQIQARADNLGDFSAGPVGRECVGSCRVGKLHVAGQGLLLSGGEQDLFPIDEALFDVRSAEDEIQFAESLIVRPFIPDPYVNIRIRVGIERAVG